MPTATILIGLPACGKSTWREQTQDPLRIVISSDDYIEMKAADENTTYNAVFKKYIQDADAQCKRVFKMAVDQNWDVVVDRTNSSLKARSFWLQNIPAHYRKVAIVFALPQTDEDHAKWQHRLESREGKTIPQDVLETMWKTFSIPYGAEGFDEVQFINTFRG